MIQAKVRSTTHLRRMTTKPFIQGMRRTISRVTLGVVLRPDDQLSSVSAVRKDALDEWKPPPGSPEDTLRAVAVLDVRAMDFDRQQPPVGVRQDVPLAPVDALSGVITLGSPFWSAVRTVWLSMIAAEGEASRPARSRSAMTSVW